LLDWTRAHHADLTGLEVRRPSLEDAYLAITGGIGAHHPEHRMEDSQ
jgi:hypothetical protein